MRVFPGARKGQYCVVAGGQALAYRRAMGFRFAVFLLALLAAGCGRVTDSEQLRLCRLILPVLHAEGAEIREVKAGPDPLGRSGVRIDYVVREADGNRRPSFAISGFAGTTFERDRLELTGIETDTGPVSEVRLLFLKRFWLPE